MNRGRVPVAIAAAALLIATLLAGVVAGVASAGHVTAVANGLRSSATTQHVTGQPGVTAVPTTTTPADELPGYGKPMVLLGDENTPEQFIIGQLYKLALEHQGYSVSLSLNVNHTNHIALRALAQGSLDLYPAYLDQWNQQIPSLHRRFQTLAASYRAAVQYASKQQVVLLPPTPYGYTAGLAVTRVYQSQNHITSISGLVRHTGVIIAAPLNWITDAHGLPAVERAYGIEPGCSVTLPVGARCYVQQIAFGLQYLWLQTGNVNVAYANTTDPQLSGPDYRLLSDPKHVFGFGNVVPVTTAQVLAAEGPQFARTIEHVDAILTTTAMRGLNAEVQLSGHGPSAVAQQFLQGHGLLTPVQYEQVTPASTTSTLATTTTRGGS